MDEWLAYKPSGEYITDTLDKFGREYTTFIPDPLLNLTIKMDPELVALLSNAHRLLGQLEGMADLLPNASAVNTIMLQKEAWLSCQIDGIVTPFYDVLNTFQKKEMSAVSVKSYISAMAIGLKKAQTVQYKNAILCAVHKELDLKDNHCIKGEFRTEHTAIGKIMVTSVGFPIYNPTSPTHILKTMRDLERFINRNDEMDILIKVALAHYQFETIHPFVSGNGFAGRILPYLIIANKKTLTSPLVCLSHFLSLNKVEYIDRMEALRRKHDYEQWVKFYVKAIIFAADDSLKRIKKWLQIRDKNIAKIERSSKSIKAILLFYDSIERHPIFDINTISQDIGISYNTGVAATKQLSKMGIVRQVNKFERYRSFACIDFLDCFTDKELLPICWDKETLICVEKHE